MKLRQLMLGVLLMIVATLSSFPIVAKETSPVDVFNGYKGKACLKACADSDLILISVQETARDLSLDPNDLLAIMRVESSFKAKARNRDSVGLMQVNLKYHAKKFKTSPYDVPANTFVGATVYKACLTKRNGNKAKALRCYNGENAKNMIYPNKVLKVLKEIKSLNIFPTTLNPVTQE